MPIPSSMKHQKKSGKCLNNFFRFYNKKWLIRKIINHFFYFLLFWRLDCVHCQIFKYIYPSVNHIFIWSFLHCVEFILWITIFDLCLYLTYFLSKSQKFVFLCIILSSINNLFHKLCLLFCKFIHFILHLSK